MAINIIERIISPYNSSPNTVIHKDRYNLFVPLADVNKVGIAGYSPEYFTVRRNIVELNNVFTASLVLNKVNDNYPYTGVRANTIYSAYNATVIDRRQPDGTETLMSVVGSLLVLSDRYDGGVNTLTEVLFAEGRIWLRKTRVGDDGTINILTKFEPVFDKCVTENQLGDFSVSTRKIIDGAIQASKIARGAVTGDKIADDAIDSSKIIDGAITVDKLADDSISSVSYDPKTGVLTFTTLKNETQKIDLPLELLIISGRYDKETKDLILVLANDTEIIIPLDDIIAQIESLSTKIYVGGTLEDRLDFTDDPQKQLNKSVNVSKVQTFTSEEKTQALSNIGIEANPVDSPNADLYTIKLAGETYSVPHVEMTLSDESDYTAAKIRTIRFGDDKYRFDGDYVSYLEEQMLTEESKARARKNIGVDATVAGSRVYVNGVLKDTVDFDSDPQSQIDNRVRFDRAQSLTEGEKVTARRNIGIDGSTIGTKINVNGTPQDVVEFDSDPQGQIYRIGQGGMFAGKNMLDFTARWEYFGSSSIDSYSEGVLTLSNLPASGSTPYIRKDFPCKPNTKYTVSLSSYTGDNESTNVISAYVGAATSVYLGGILVSEYQSGKRSFTVTTRDNQYSIRILVYTGGAIGIAGSRTFTNIQLEEGSTATAWEEYKGVYLNTSTQDLSDAEKQTARNNINASRVSVDGVYKDSVEFTGDPQEQLNNRVFGASVSYTINGGAGWYRVADLRRTTSAYNFDMGGGYVTTRSPEVCGTLSIGFDANIEPIVTVSHCRSSGWWSKFRVIYDKTALSGTAYLEIYKTTATRELFGISLIPEYETALFNVYREETAGSIPSGYTAVEYDLQDGANFPSLKVDGNPVLHTGEMALSDVEKQQVHRNIGLMKTETKAATPSAWYRFFSVKKKKAYASFSFSFYVESLHNNFASGVANVNIYTYPDSTPTIKKIYYTSLSGVDLSKKIRLVEDDTNIYIAVQDFGNYNKITAAILSYGFVTYSLSDFTIESVEIPEPSSYTACANGIIQTRIDSKYTKPSTGIPETDLAQDVQDKINSGGSPYSITIKTQAQFEEFVTKCTDGTLSADIISVLFDGSEVGNTGFVIDRSNANGVKFPMTLKQVQGINNAKLVINNISQGFGAIYYEDNPAEDSEYTLGIGPTNYSYGNDCYIRDLRVESNGTCFYNCANLMNCVAKSSTCGFEYCIGMTNCTANVRSLSGNLVAYLNCSRMVNCICNVKIDDETDTDVVECFKSCTFIRNCRLNSIEAAEHQILRCIVFSGCNDLADCVHVSNAHGYSACYRLVNCEGTDFRHCTNLTNCYGHNITRGDTNAYVFFGCSLLNGCVGAGRGKSTGYAFYSCSYCSTCRQDPYLTSTTAPWGGTNTKVSKETCDTNADGNIP